MALVLDLESNAETRTMPRMSTVDRSRSSVVGIDDDVSGPIVLDLERRHGQALFGFVRRLGLSDAQASDAVQDVMLRLWIELQAGRAIEQPKAWAFRTIYRLAMDQSHPPTPG